MNRFAAALLMALIVFIAGFSWHTWRTEKAFLIKEQGNVLEFVTGQMNAYLDRIENGLIRFSLELTDGGAQSNEQAQVLLNGVTVRTRDFLGAVLIRPDGTIVNTKNLPPGLLPSPIDANSDGMPTMQSRRRSSGKHPESSIGRVSQAVPYSDAQKKSGLYRDFWNADIQEKHDLIIEPITTELMADSHMLLAHYHHHDEKGRFVHRISVVFSMRLLKDYWQTTDTLKNSALWIMTDNGRLLNFYPARSQLQIDEVFPKTATDTLMAHLRQTGFPARGQLDVRLDTDNAPQLAVFQRLKYYPFSVFISIPNSTIWANWWNRVQIPFFLSFILLVLGLVVYRKTLSDQSVREQEQIQMQEQLRISNERWKLALECAGEGIWETNYQTGEIQFSGRSPEIIDCVDGEQKMSLERWIDLIHPEDRPRARKAIQAYSSGAIPEFQIEPRILCKDGQWKWLLVRGNAIRQDDEGNPLHVLGTLTDITAQKNSLRQLEKSEGLLRQGFILFPTGVAVLSEEGVVIEANPALCRMFGYSEDEIVGVPFEQFFLDKDADHQLLQLAISSKKQSFSTSMERVAAHRSMHRFPVIYKLTMTRDSNGAETNFIAQIEDLSQRKQEQFKGMAKEILAAQEQDRAQLSRDLHDQIGQLLTVLKLTLELVRQSLPDVKNAESNLNNGQRVLDTLMESIRNITNRIRPVVIEQLGLISALRSHLAKNIRPLGQSVILVENIGENRLPENLELCCFRVIQEALTNCLRHAQAAHVEVSLTRASSRLTLSVKDDGIGFDISQYYSCHEYSRSLGIVGMHERVAACGGELQIRSTLGAGAEVLASFNISGEA
jgi:PAS domain S-box-containing protein